MSKARFILSKQEVKNKIKNLQEKGLDVSYSFKTNHPVGKVIEKLIINNEIEKTDFSIHDILELEKFEKETIENNRIWFFTQAESKKQLKEILNRGIKKFVVDNEQDLNNLLEVIKNKENEKRNSIDLLLRMKFQEHRVGTGKYFVYGMNSGKVNELISELNKQENRKHINNLGIHLHRKTQNTSEWEIVEEIKDSLSEKTLQRVEIINLGGGLPAEYVSSNKKMYNYIFQKLEETKEFLRGWDIKTVIEPGRYIAGPSVRLETEIIQIQDKNLIVNVSVYNCSLDCVLTGTKMLVKDEVTENEINNEEYVKGEVGSYLIKGNSPTRDDIFRYKVKLPKSKVKVGNKIVFLNAGAYNYATDFFGYKKLETEIVEEF
ncbi:MAG TPA: decarboxylase [Candidatus Nanoarchaeia archaeon]|nr:decarboxylase [Candidatus Nanoarchaeia archaeon]